MKFPLTRVGIARCWRCTLLAAALFGGTIGHAAEAPPAEWQQYRAIIVGTLLFILAQSLLIVALLSSIAARKRAQRELAEFSRDFESFLDQTTDFVYFKDTHTRFRFCSQTLAAITGHANRREMIGKHDREVFPPDTARIYEEEERPVFAEGRPLLNKIDPYYDTAGRPGYVQTNKWPLFDDHGKVVSIFGISRAVTERMAANASCSPRTIRSARSWRSICCGMPASRPTWPLTAPRPCGAHAIPTTR